MTATQGFLWNVVLAVFWGLATGSLTIVTLGVGFLIGFIALYITRRAVGAERYLTKIERSARLVLFFLYDLITANLRIAADIVTPTHYMRPAMVAIPLDASSDGEITMMANLITLTPGSLSVHVSEDRRTLYIHYMYVRDLEQLRQEIKHGLEQRLLAVMR